MSASAHASCLPLSYETFTRLASVLDNEALGCAVQLIAYQTHVGQGLPDDIAAAHLKLHKKTWARLRAVLAPHFVLDDARWSFPALLKTQPAARVLPALQAAPAPVAFTARKAAPYQPMLFPSAPKGPAVETAPLKPEKPQLPSLSQSVFNIGLQLLTENGGRSEIAARTLIGQMLKNHDIGFVTAAINDAWRNRDQVAEPLSWIRNKLKRYPTREEERAGRHTPANAPSAAAKKQPAHAAKPSVPVIAGGVVVSPSDFLGPSEGMRQKMMARPVAPFTFVDRKAVGDVKGK